MTNKTKSATIVFALTAMLMAMPLATTSVFADEVDANLNVECGFSTTNLAALDFGGFTPSDSAATVGEEEVELTDAGSASARVLVTVADWKTIGTRATGTIILASAAVADSVTLGSQTYAAVSSSPTGNEWLQTGDDIADAAALAAIIRTIDAANYKVSTSGTDTVTVNTVARGTSENSGNTLSEDTSGTTIVTEDSTSNTGTNILNGAVDTPLTIMDGDTTKFDMNVGSTATDTYANKVSVIAVDSSQEVLGGTTEENIFFALMIDPASAVFNSAALPYDGPITQEITILVESACDGT